MKYFWMILAVALLSLVAYAHTSLRASPQAKISFSGGPGDTPETAVVIAGAKNSMEGIGAEYRYLEQKFGRRGVGWQLKRQSLYHQQGKVYDRMELEFKDGSKKTLYFEISEFFGKL